MATTTPSQPAETKAEALDRPDFEQRGVPMHDIGWRGYLTLLKLRGERKFPRMVYLDGTVWLMTTSFPHERLAERLGLFVMVVVEELDIPCKQSGSTTFRRKRKRGGVEPDKSFYLANAHRIQADKDIHLSKDPPPDLAVEVVKSHGAEAAVEVCRRFGVPEVWVCDGSELNILALQATGRYAKSESSVAFPVLKDAEILGWVTRPGNDTDTQWVKDLRIWVRDTLKPRALGAGGGA
jgi:Uma2 family endonuclease